MMTYFMYVKCAWCGKLMKRVETNDPNMNNKISHGICKDCFEKTREEYMKELKTKRRKK